MKVKNNLKKITNNMNRTFILDCISLIQSNENQFMTDGEFNELCELHQIHENSAIQQLFCY